MPARRQIPRWSCLRSLRKLLHEPPPEGWSSHGRVQWRSSSGDSPLRSSCAAAQCVLEPLPLDFSRADLKPKGWDRVVIHPDNRIKACFESFIVFCVLYTAVLEPVKVTFAIEINPEVDLFLDLLFVVDLGIQFISGYHNAGGKRFAVLSLRRVVNNYLRTWFAIDLVAAIPFDRFYSMGHRVSAEEDQSVLVRLPGLIKIVRLLKLRRTIRKWTSLSYGPLLKVITILSGWLLVAHWFACGWFILGWYTCPHYKHALHVQGPWVVSYFPNLTSACTSGAPPDARRFPETIGLNYFDVLMRCLYWALATMSSMGYGNAPRADSTADYIYACSTQVVGACLAAAIFSNVAQMINQGDLKNARYQQQLDRVRAFARLHKLSPSVRGRLFGYHELLFAVNHGLDLPAIASMFPRALQSQVFLDEHRLRLMQVPMFRKLASGGGTHDLFLAAVASLLRSSVVLDGDLIFHAGEVGDRMFFLQKGYVRITAPPGGACGAACVRVNGGGAYGETALACLGPGHYFGEVALFASVMAPTAADAREGFTTPKSGLQGRRAALPSPSSRMYRRAGTAAALSDCIRALPPPPRARDFDARPRDTSPRDGAHGVVDAFDAWASSQMSSKDGAPSREGLLHLPGGVIGHASASML